MSYTNISSLAELPIDKLFRFVQSRPKNFLNAHVLTRTAHLIVAPFEIVAAVADTIIGLGVGALSVASFGASPRLFEVASLHLGSARDLMQKPYLHLLRSINPKAHITINQTVYGLAERAFIFTPLRNANQKCLDSDNLLMRQVGTRLTYALLALSTVVARVAEGILGSAMATLAILTVGYSKKLNTLACESLITAFYIQNMLFYSVKILNPKADVYRCEPYGWFKY